MNARNVRNRGAIPNRVAMALVAPMAGERSMLFIALCSSGVIGLSNTVSRGSISCWTGGGGGMPIPAIGIWGIIGPAGAVAVAGSILPHLVQIA